MWHIAHVDGRSKTNHQFDVFIVLWSSRCHHKKGGTTLRMPHVEDLLLLGYILNVGYESGKVVITVFVETVRQDYITLEAVYRVLRLISHYIMLLGLFSISVKEQLCTYFRNAYLYFKLILLFIKDLSLIQSVAPWVLDRRTIAPLT